EKKELQTKVKNKAKLLDEEQCENNQLTEKITNLEQQIEKEKSTPLPTTLLYYFFYYRPHSKITNPDPTKLTHSQFTQTNPEPIKCPPPQLEVDNPELESQLDNLIKEIQTLCSKIN
ncbi:906_t:CDS:2, partial [Funneliformis geosporum]